MILARFFSKAGDVLPVRVFETEDQVRYLVPENFSAAAAQSLVAEVFAPEERDIREVLARVTGALAERGLSTGLFKDAAAATVFSDELTHILFYRRATLEPALLRALGDADLVFSPQEKILSFGNVAAGAGLCLAKEEENAVARLKIFSQELTLSGEKAVALLPVENPDAQGLIGWHQAEDTKAAAQAIGRKALQQGMRHVLDAVDRDSVFGFDPAHNAALARAVDEAKAFGLNDAAIDAALARARDGAEDIDLGPGDDNDDGLPPVFPVLSLPDNFVEAALTGHGFMSGAGGARARHVSAARLWDDIADGVWQTGAPGVFFRDAAAFLGQETAQSSTGGFIFLADTAAPQATIDLNSPADADALLYTARVLTVALDLALDLAEVTPETRRWRPLCIGLTGLSARLMRDGLAYDSDAARAEAALTAALVTGAAQLASAELAASLGVFAEYRAHEKEFLQQVKDRIAVFSGVYPLQKGVARRVAMPAFSRLDPARVKAAEDLWRKVYAAGRESGFRHAVVTGGARLTPESALVRFEGYASQTLEGAAIYGKKLNPAVPEALEKLGYSAADIDDIYFYAAGHGTLLDAPAIHHAALRQKGFHQAALQALESALKTAQHIRYAFNKWTLGEDFCRHALGFSADDLARGDFDILSALGFDAEEIEAANLYCCGAMTLEGAPHLLPAHTGVFDCAPVAGWGIRAVSAEAQLRLQAAVEVFLSGGALSTLLLDHDASVSDVQKLLLKGWELGVKGVRLYRAGCGLSAPYVRVEKNKKSVKREEAAAAPRILIKEAS